MTRALEVAVLAASVAWGCASLAHSGGGACLTAAKGLAAIGVCVCLAELGLAAGLWRLEWTRGFRLNARPSVALGLVLGPLVLAGRLVVAAATATSTGSNGEDAGAASGLFSARRWQYMVLAFWASVACSAASLVSLPSWRPSAVRVVPALLAVGALVEAGPPQLAYVFCVVGVYAITLDICFRRLLRCFTFAEGAILSQGFALVIIDAAMLTVARAASMWQTAKVGGSFATAPSWLVPAMGLVDRGLAAAHGGLNALPLVYASSDGRMVSTTVLEGGTLGVLLLCGCVVGAVSKSARNRRRIAASSTKRPDAAKRSMDKGGGGDGDGAAEEGAQRQPLGWAASGAFLLALAGGLVSFVLPWISVLMGPAYDVPLGEWWDDNSMPPGHPMRPVAWLVGFLMAEGARRMTTCVFWIALIGACVAAMLLALHRSRRTTQDSGASKPDKKRQDRGVLSSYAVRKTYHALAVAIFAPVTLWQPWMMRLSFGVAISAFVVLESVRALRVKPLGQALHDFIVAHVDARDGGVLVCTHIYLLLGCALPTWVTVDLSRGGPPPPKSSSAPSAAFPPAFPPPFAPPSASGAGAGAGASAAAAVSLGGGANAAAQFYYSRLLLQSLVPFAGIVTLGIGDSAAALVGLRFGKTKWPGGSRKSLEGTLAMVAAVLFALAAGVWLGARAGFSGDGYNDDALTVGVWQAAMKDAHRGRGGTGANGTGTGFVLLAAAEVVAATVLCAVLEAVTDQIDNLVLPLHFAALLMLACGGGPAAAVWGVAAS